MNNKKIKLIAISVAMVLSTQIVLAEDLINDFGGLTDALNKATGSSVTVNFNNNSAKTPRAVGGGAMALVAANGNAISTTIKNSTFTNNSTESSPSYKNNGGAIYNGIKKLTISNTIFDGNKTNDGGKGGAIYNAGNISLSQTEFKQSSDTIYIANDSTADFSDTNTLNGSISSENATSKIKNTGTLILNADNSGYTGTYTQESGQTDVNESSTFFGGETTIAGGVLN